MIEFLYVPIYPSVINHYSIFTRQFMKKNRILAVDLMRGLSLLGMMLVNLTPDEGLSFPALVHTEWSGISLADIFFPCFLFLAGVSVGIQSERKVFGPGWLKNSVCRGVILILTGMVYNHLPCFWALIFNADYGFQSFLQDVTLRFRPFGVLQRIGFAYIFGVLIYHAVKTERKLLLSAFAILAATTAGFFLFQPAEPFAESGNISIWVDQALQGSSHNYQQKIFDPEGLYGNITAIASILFGMAAGSWLKSGHKTNSVCWGCMLALSGWLVSAFVIVSKPLWTASYVMILSGCFMIVLPVLDEMIHLCKKAELWFALPILLGSHSMLTYLISGNIEAILNTVKTGDTNLYHLIWQNTVYFPDHLSLSCFLCSLMPIICIGLFVLIAARVLKKRKA